MLPKHELLWQSVFKADEPKDDCGATGGPGPGSGGFKPGNDCAADKDGGEQSVADDFRDAFVKLNTSPGHPDYDPDILRNEDEYDLLLAKGKELAHKLTARNEGETDQEYVDRMRKLQRDTVGRKPSDNPAEERANIKIRGIAANAMHPVVEKINSAGLKKQKQEAAEYNKKQKEKIMSEMSVKPTVDKYTELAKKKTKIEAMKIGANWDTRRDLPKPRGGHTKEKIIKYLKKAGGADKSERLFNAEIAKYKNADDLEDHLFYHGTGGSISNLRPSVSMKEGDYISGGGYGEKYWGVSLSKDRDIASNFTGSSDSGSVAPVLLKKGAKVIDMPSFTDAADVEDHIESLWDKGVDAVKIGDWKGNSEKELLVLNPKSIVVGKPEGYSVYNKKKMPSFDKVKIQSMYDSAADNYETSGGRRSDIEAFIKKRESSSTQAEQDSKSLPCHESLWLSVFKADDDCGANAPGGGGFQPGNDCAADKDGDESASGKRTKAFDEWFGDSKVVDENGDPLVVYHGVKDPKIKEIKDGKIVWDIGFDVFDTEGGMEAGAYFSPDINVAKKYGTPIPFYLRATSPIQKEDPISSAPHNADSIFRTRGKSNKIQDAWEIAVFNPSQIKMAVGNENPTDDPSIHKSADSPKSDCGANAPGGGGFQPGNDCAADKDGGGDEPASGKRTKAFDEWFGDSKVVDENGEPLVLYHGSAAENIEEFDVSRAGTVQRSDWGEGVYFTPDEGLAETYASEAIGRSDSASKEANEKLDEYLKENGGRGDMYMRLDLRAGKITQEVYDVAQEMDREASRLFYESRKKKGTVYPAYVRMKNPYYYTYGGITDPYLADIAKGLGHDGIIIAAEGSSSPKDWEEVIVFDPKQIKSVDNEGTFDPDNPSIYKSKDNCGANAPGGGGFQPGNDCAADSGDGKVPDLSEFHEDNYKDSWDTGEPIEASSEYEEAYEQVKQEFIDRRSKMLAEADKERWHKDPDYRNKLMAEGANSKKNIAALKQKAAELAVEQKQNRSRQKFRNLISDLESRKYPIPAYRSIRIDASTKEEALQKLNLDDVGEYWSRDMDRARPAMGRSEQMTVMLRASVPSDDVDWQKTIDANMNPKYGDREKEITINPSTSLAITGIKVLDRGQDYTEGSFEDTEVQANSGRSGFYEGWDEGSGLTEAAKPVLSEIYRTKSADKPKSDCGANAPGGGGFQPGNDCAAKDKDGGAAEGRTTDRRTGKPSIDEREKFRIWEDDVIRARRAFDPDTNWTGFWLYGEDPDGNKYEGTSITVNSDGYRVDEHPDMRYERYEEDLDANSPLAEELTTARENQDLTEEQIAAIRDYTGGSSARRINGMVRSGESYDAQKIKEAGQEYLDTKQKELKRMSELAKSESDPHKFLSKARTIAGRISAENARLQKALKFAEIDMSNLTSYNDHISTAQSLGRSLMKDLNHESTILKEIRHARDIAVGFEPDEWGDYPDSSADEWYKDEHLESITSTAERLRATFSDDIGMSIRPSSETASKIKELIPAHRAKDKALIEKLKSSIGYLREDKKSVRVYRGITVDSIATKRIYDEIISGDDKFQLDGFGSTSIRTRISNGHMDDKSPGILLKINTKKGLWMEPNTKHDGEEEVVLAPHTQLRITDKNLYNVDGVARLVVEMDVIDE